MKKTTYMMLVAAVGGMLAVSAVVAMFLRSYTGDGKDYVLGGDQCSVSLAGGLDSMAAGEVHKVTFVDECRIPDSSILIKNYKGIAVAESDTAREVTLSTARGWLPYLDCKVDSGCLTVTVDYEAIKKTYLEGKIRKVLNLRSDHFVAARVIMPRGWLKEVAARDKTLYLDSIKADEILCKVDDRLVLNNSEIGLLNSRAKRIRELKLENSTVKKACFKAVDKYFTVNCTSDTSVISFLQIDGVYHDAKNLNIKLKNADIKDLKFPQDSGLTVEVTSRYKNDIEQN